MVKHPDFCLHVNGKDITDSLRPYLVSIEYTDDIDDSADGFTMKFQGKNFSPPQFSDKLKVWLGYRDDLWFIGSFSVLKSRIEFNTMEIEITASPVDFSTTIKEKRTETFKDTTLDNILKTIAKRNNLKLKNSFKAHAYTSKSHSGTSDLEFMQRLAKEVGATFAVKNETIIFSPKNKTAQDGEMVNFTLDVSKINGLNFEITDKTKYLSSKASWHSVKDNKTLSVTVGNGSPCLNIHGNFKNESEARTIATSKLEAQNRGTIRGSFGCEGMNIIAGAKVSLKGLPNGWENSFGIKSVRHSWSDGGYSVNLEIEN